MYISTKSCLSMILSQHEKYITHITVDYRKGRPSITIGYMDHLCILNDDVPKWTEINYRFDLNQCTLVFPLVLLSKTHSGTWPSSVTKFRASSFVTKFRVTKFRVTHVWITDLIILHKISNNNSSQLAIPSTLSLFLSCPRITRKADYIPSDECLYAYIKISNDFQTFKGEFVTRVYLLDIRQDVTQYWCLKYQILEVAASRYIKDI